MRIGEFISQHELLSTLDKRLRFLANLFFGASWLFFAIRVAQQWHTCSIEIHHRDVNFGVLSLFFWMCLLSEKNSGITMVIALVTLGTVFRMLLSCP